MMEKPSLLNSLFGFKTAGSYNDDECALSSHSSKISETDSLTSTSSGSIDNSNESISLIKRYCCSLCNEVPVKLRILSCMHTFCQLCLESNKEYVEKLMCPQCKIVSSFPYKDFSEILANSSKRSLNGSNESLGNYCCGSKNNSFDVVAHCFDCNHPLCSNCVTAHKIKQCFERHRWFSLSSENFMMEAKSESSTPKKDYYCPRHKPMKLELFCNTCNVPVCQKCTSSEHPPNNHDCGKISIIGPKQVETLNQTVQDSKSKAAHLSNMVKSFQNLSGLLNVQYNKAQRYINETFEFYCSMLEERRVELLAQLEDVVSEKKVSLESFCENASKVIEHTNNTCDFYEKMSKNSQMIECLMFKKLIESKLKDLASINVDTNVYALSDCEFVSNFQAIQTGVKNTFGYLRSVSYDEFDKQPSRSKNKNVPSFYSCPSLYNKNSLSMPTGLNSLPDRQFNSIANNPGLPFGPNNISQKVNTTNALGSFSTSMCNINSNSKNTAIYQKWTSGSDIFHSNTGLEYSPTPLSRNIESNIGSTYSSSTSLTQLPVIRHKMVYHNKFGEYGILEGQFTEPSGIAVTAQNDIIVADTNNHRVQVFDKDGRFKFKFGDTGKKDGLLLYPNCVAVMKKSGDIIVTERSPTHRIQIYNHYGQFVRKFGSDVLQHPRGVTVDNKGRIIVVECKVMKVIIFDQYGTVLKKFGCSKHIEFPNCLAVNDFEEIFISDNRGHCVKVFDYEGNFLRKIGGEGLTNYPIGVAINNAGEVLIADNYNNFNVTVFSQSGQLLYALESKVKHSQCFGIGLLNKGSVAVASKDYHIYVYRYSLCPPYGR